MTADQRTPRIYTAADAAIWAEQLRDNRIKARNAALAIAWTALRASRPEMTVMHVCDGFAYDGEDARSLTIRLSKLSGRETK